jgi:Ras-related protein Rab-1A
MKMWFEIIDKNADKNVNKFLVGNKSDLTLNRVVDYAKGKVC